MNTADTTGNKSDESLDIKTFVFLDIETTGLPSEEHNKTKLTELSMVAVQANHIRLGVFPRVQNKLNICFNPRKMVSFEAENLTGLCNDLLEHQTSFTSGTVDLINGFLSQNKSPICMVAHNGNFFDYPVLRAEIIKTNTSLTDIVCVDSLEAFRQLYFKEQQRNKTESDDVDSFSQVHLEFLDEDNQLLAKISQDIEDKIAKVQRTNETTPVKQKIRYRSPSVPTKKMKVCTTTPRFNFGISFKLTDIFHRLTGKKAINAHQAESDVLMLITCAATMGDEFVDWANKNSKRFCDIPPMTPGKKIGS